MSESGLTYEDQGLTKDEMEAYVSAAREQCNDTLEIDDDETVVSVSEEGVWVRAWVWVPNDDVNERF